MDVIRYAFGFALSHPITVTHGVFNDNITMDYALYNHFLNFGGMDTINNSEGFKESLATTQKSLSVRCFTHEDWERTLPIESLRPVTVMIFYTIILSNERRRRQYCHHNVFGGVFR